MYTRIFVVSLALMMLLIAGVSAQSEDKMIECSGLSAFVHKGRTYLPVKDVSTFLGAQTQWDGKKGQVRLERGDQTLLMSPYSYEAMAGGESVKLSAYPLLIDGQIFVPANALQQYFETQVQWDKAAKQARILGPDGWGAVVVKSTPWHGGPPPWAPAWGRRGHKGGK